MLPTMYSAEPMTPFLLVVMQEVPIEGQIENNADSVLEATQAVLAIWDNVHVKAAPNIKWTQLRQVHIFDRWNQATTLKAGG